MHADVEIVSARDFSRDDVVIPARFALRFPAHWRARPVRNRYAHAIERKTIAWLRSFEIGCNASEAEKLAKFNCGRYGGYSLPRADYRSALLVTQFISLWLFWDDVQVEEELDWDLEAVLEALDGNARPANASRYVLAWFDLGRRLRATQSQRWFTQLGTAMRQWLENAKRETAIAKRFLRDGVCPEFERWFDCRTVSIGMYPTFHLIELTEGFELGEAIHKDEIVVALKRLASRLVGLGNDLGGLAKDLRNRWLNLVLVQKAEHSLSIEESFARVVEIHNRDVQEFDRLAAQLPRLGSEADALLRGWVQAVRHNVYGFTLWESTSERYQEHTALVGDRALIAPVVSGNAARVQVEPLRRVG
jgi:hypothetical protein